MFLLTLFATAAFAQLEVFQTHSYRYEMYLSSEDGTPLLYTTQGFSSFAKAKEAGQGILDRCASADSFTDNLDSGTGRDSSYALKPMFFRELTSADGEKLAKTFSYFENDSSFTADALAAACTAAGGVAPNDYYEAPEEERKRIGKFEVFQDIAGQFRFRLKAGNGEIILVSEAYTAKHNAFKGIRSVKVNSVDDSNFRQESSSAEQPYFNLVAGNNEIIGTSEMYSSAAARQNGIDSVMFNAPLAPIVDLTEGKPAASKAKLEFYQSTFGDYSWRLVGSDNTQVLVQGYMWESKPAAEAEVAEFVKVANKPENWVLETETGLPYGATPRFLYVLVKEGESYTSGVAVGFTNFYEREEDLAEIKTAVSGISFDNIETDKQWAERNGRFTIFCGENAEGEKTGKFYWRLQAANYRIILQSQAYVSKQGAQVGIDSVITNAPDSDQFVKKTSKDGKPYFVLKAKNGQVIGSSETYNSNASRDNGIASIQRNIANGAEKVDNATGCSPPPSYADECENIYDAESCREEEEPEYRKEDNNTGVVSVAVSALVIAAAFVF